MSGAPLRSDTHRIDTLAVRRLISVMNENWIVRDLSERDYGIDLMVEYWDHERPTGKTAFFQIKGKRDPVIVLKRDPVVSFYDFPVKTLLYAEHFPEPFFLIHLSVEKDQPIYFLWLQRYIQLELNRTTPEWRNEEKINITIPSINDFLRAENHVLGIVSKNVLMKKSMRFLMDYYFWDRHIEELIEEGIMEIKPNCLSYISKFKAYRSFFEELADGIGGTSEIDFEQAVTHIHTFNDVYRDAETRDWLRDFRARITSIVDQIMLQEEVEEAVMETTGDTPY